MALVKFTTNHGDFTLDIDEVNAPKTAANFLQYVKDGHYDNTIFHRVIDGFMIQGGGFEPGMKQKSGRAPIQHEGVATSAAGLKNTLYTVAMARTGDPHSATAQFYINHGNNDMLNFPSRDGFGYVAFGKVVSGIEVVDKIAEVATTTKPPHQNVPQTPVVIEKVTLLTKK